MSSSESSTSAESVSLSSTYRPAQQTRAKLTASSKLKAVKDAITIKNTLSVAVFAMELSQQLARLIPIPGAKEVLSILTGILKHVQKMQTDQEECMRLAGRAVDMVVVIYTQLESLEASAPTQLLRNLDKFIQTLHEVHDFMQAEADSRWHSRLFRIQSPSVSQRLKEYDAKFDAARRDFEMATLINIHYHVALPDRANYSLGDSIHVMESDGVDAVSISTETEPPEYAVSGYEMQSCEDASDIVEPSNGENTISLELLASQDSLFTYKAKALYGYTASDDDPSEISFSRGDIIDIIGKEGKWWQALKPDGTIGVVPSNYMQII